MRKIGIPEIEDIATGAALLGAGGGGDPYVGKLVAIGAVQECGPVTLLEPEEVPDDALIVPIAMMGAPTVLAEKAIGGTEYQKLFEMVSKFFGQKIYAFMPIEAGGVNSMLPIAAAARLGMPMVDVDGMGRAFPELQMVTFFMPLRLKASMQVRTPRLMPPTGSLPPETNRTGSCLFIFARFSGFSLRSTPESRSRARPTVASKPHHGSAV